MSVDSTELRKSTLQRKDREELTAIATALGAKPSSRARKAEIVDLILDTVADGDESEPDEPDQDEDSTEKGSGDRPDTGREPAAAAEAADKSRDDGGDQPEAGNRRRRRRGRGADREPASDNWDGDPIPVSGFLDLRDEGYGFLRTNGWVPSKDDAYVPVKMVRQFGLRKGDELAGASRPANQNEKNPAILTIESVNGADPAEGGDRVEFDALVPALPTEQLVQALTGDTEDPTGRIIDIVAPLAKGQRTMVVGSPATDASAILKSITRSIEANNPEVHIIVLLVDERPEDAIDFKRHLGKGEVQASTFDRPADEHVLVAEMTIERAKRMTEFGADVCVVMNGISRLARAYDAVAPSAGRSNRPVAIDPWAVYQTKKFLGAARNVDGGGSLTVIATVDSGGSDADRVILEQVADTAGAVLRLDDRAAHLQIRPPVDPVVSGTRHLEAILDGARLEQNRSLRRALAEAGDDALDSLLTQLAATSNNTELDPARLG